MRVAVAQMHPVAGDPPANRERARELVGEAARDGADLVVLPELFTVGYFAFDAWADGAEPLDGPTVEMAAKVATAHDVAVLAGSFVEDLGATAHADGPAAAGLANTSVLVGPDGERRAHYRKAHLFGYESAEQELLIPGEGLGTAAIGDHTVGIATCYDLRFPELFRAYTDAGVTLLLVTSAWPSARPEHWRLLCRVRALENQCALAAANGVGDVGDETLLGESMVVDPWGEMVASAGQAEGVAAGEVPRSAVDEVRETFPALADRRPEISRW